MNYTDIESRSDCEFVYVHNATVSVLTRFLDLTVPWVWILGHCPNRHAQWWNTTVPLNDNGSIYTGAVRLLSFDLQLSTLEFVSRAADFDEYGLVLIQSHKQMPATLSLDGIPEWQQTNVLRQNGGTLRIYLPHAIETAQIQSFTKGYLKTVIGT